MTTIPAAQKTSHTGIGTTPASIPTARAAAKSGIQFRGKLGIPPPIVTVAGRPIIPATKQRQCDASQQTPMNPSERVVHSGTVALGQKPRNLRVQPNCNSAKCGARNG